MRLHPFSIQRMLNAVDKVRERLLRTAATLDAAGVPYAVTGGNAVAAWVARVDEAAVRNTRDVDILLRRADLERATAAMERAGFLHRHAKSLDMFLDGPDSKARDAVHVVFAGEKVRPEDALPTAEVDESESGPEFRVVALEALVRMKLTSYRLKDQVHVQDMIEVGLVDESWYRRLPEILVDRLRLLIETRDE